MQLSKKIETKETKNKNKSKNKNEHTEYHDFSIPFKSHIYSNQESRIFLLFGALIIVLLPHVWTEPKFLLLTPT